MVCGCKNFLTLHLLYINFLKIVFIMDKILYVNIKTVRVYNLYFKTAKVLLRFLGYYWMDI